MDFSNIIGELEGQLGPEVKMLVDEYQKIMADGKIDMNDMGEVMNALKDFAAKEGIPLNLLDEALKILNLNK